MVVDRTLYDVLEVDPNASQQDIIKAIKMQSLKHHPDRGGSVEMMQKVNAAKEILTDSEKRKVYDRYGLEGIKSKMSTDHSQGFPGGIFDIFDMFNRGSNHRNHTRVSKGSDIKHSLKVSLEDLYSGTTKKIEIDRDVVCKYCKGSGSNDGIQRECSECSGTGVETLVYRMGPIIQQTQAQCSSCHGTGNHIDHKNKCKKCHGNKILKEKKVFDVNITHGTQNGETIKYIGEGNQSPNGESGNVYFVLKQEPHHEFKRRNDDLISNMDINLTESLCGFKRIVKLLDGHELLINHPYGQPILPNSYKVLKGYGMPNRHSHSHGDLIIRFSVIFPQDHFITTDNQRKILESLLPPKPNPRINNQQSYEEVPMVDYDFHREDFQEQQFNNNHHRHSEDDDDQHAQGIQCQTQ